MLWLLFVAIVMVTCLVSVMLIGIACVMFSVWIDSDIFYVYVWSCECYG